MRWKHNIPVNFSSNITKSAGLSHVAPLALEVGEEASKTCVVARLAGRHQVLLSVGPAMSTGADVGGEADVAGPAVAAAPPVPLEDPAPHLGPGWLVMSSRSRTRGLGPGSLTAAVLAVGVPTKLRLCGEVLTAEGTAALYVTWLNGPTWWPCAH